MSATQIGLSAVVYAEHSVFKEIYTGPAYVKYVRAKEDLWQLMPAQDSL